MVRIAFSIMAAVLCFGGVSHAQFRIESLNQTSQPADNHELSGLATVQGFNPTVLPSEQQAQFIYDHLSTSIFSRDSGCFQRAHVWSNSLFKTSQIKSYKVFLLFTTRYQREFDYDWTYHVAPLIPTQMSDGRIENLVFDPTFTSDRGFNQLNRSDKNRPLPIQDWISFFLFPNAECPLVQTLKEYEERQEQYYCYTMIAPMYQYLPENFEENHVRTDWRIGDLAEMENGLK